MTGCAPTGAVTKGSVATLSSTRAARQHRAMERGAETSMGKNLQTGVGNAYGESRRDPLILPRARVRPLISGPVEGAPQRRDLQHLEEGVPGAVHARALGCATAGKGSGPCPEWGRRLSDKVDRVTLRKFLGRALPGTGPSHLRRSRAVPSRPRRLISTHSSPHHSPYDPLEPIRAL